MARPTAHDIAARLLVLVRVHQWEAAAGASGVDLAALERGAPQNLAELREKGLEGALAPAEASFLGASPLAAPEHVRAEASWALEGIAALGWALGLVPELPGYEALVEPEFLSGFPDALPAELAAGAKPRSDAEKDRARAIAELWMWRARTRELIERGTPAPRGFKSFDEIVRKAASNAHRNKFLAELVDGDFALFGRASRDLDAGAFSTARSLALERLRAHNWLCGRAPDNRWERTPIDA